ncbi:IclR family transcriptional regulator [Pseudomonas vanderleydeniana]|uniref:IclR family transcriptional regulator n=2 Tax=Pseudomonas vanderleydeniana TaxID=2745495 RepID=A0A9E6TV29_9PSED|nr:IclR family transcriptional regulator [Pseudomonas vanderleydeniana]
MLLTELGRHLEGITVTELAQHVRLPRPTAFRLLLSLEQTGFVERVDNKYRLGWKIARLGRLADPYKGLISRLQPLLKGIADELNEMIGYAVVNGEADFDLIAEAHGSRLLTLSKGYVGTEFPVHASATGKLVMAELSDDKVRKLLPAKLESLASQTITSREAFIASLTEIREKGYSIVDDELEEGLFALAVAVRDTSQRLIGVLAITGPSQRMRARTIASIVDPLSATARIIAGILQEGQAAN